MTVRTQTRTKIKFCVRTHLDCKVQTMSEILLKFKCIAQRSYKYSTNFMCMVVPTVQSVRNKDKER